MTNKKIRKMENRIVFLNRKIQQLQTRQEKLKDFYFKDVYFNDKNTRDKYVINFENLKAFKNRLKNQRDILIDNIIKIEKSTNLIIPIQEININDLELPF